MVRAQILPICMTLTHPTTKLNAETVVALRNPFDSVAEVEAVTEQIEIPFIPVSERQHTTSTTADTIITVGQQKKKRRRNLASKGAEDNVEMFDYTIEPSLLDGGDGKEVGPAKKKRNKGTKAYLISQLEAKILTTLQEPAPIEYGNFPAPPKAHNQPRGGNQSYSFR